jgi:hypothetical protein
MHNNILKRIFEFLEEKEGHNVPFLWKFKNNIPLTEEDLNVKGDLILTYSDIESLPKGLKVGGDLDLEQTKITSLPEGLEVGGDLDLRETNITLLPKGLQVGGKLFIRGSAVINYSFNELMDMIKPGFIKGRIKV